jgi:hypothetical protein
MLRNMAKAGHYRESGPVTLGSSLNAAVTLIVSWKGASTSPLIPGRQLTQIDATGTAMSVIDPGRMAEMRDQDEPHIAVALILRMTARLRRLPPPCRDAYVSRARARFDAGRGSRNDHALLRAINVASLRGAKI